MGAAVSASEWAPIAEEVAAIKKAGVPFEDAAFPASFASIGDAIKHGDAYVWRRPADWLGGAPGAAAPSLFGAADAVAPDDVLEGKIADCFLLAAASVLAAQPALVRALFGGYDPALGVAALRLFKDDAWTTVLVDDRVPCAKGGGPELGRCRDASALWMPLLEKAFAKLYGSYSALVGGHVGETLRTLTGCAVLDYAFDHDVVAPRVKSGALFDELRARAAAGRALMGCAISSAAGVEARAAHGLLANHAYGLLGLHELDLGKGKRARLVEIRNPWGHLEWDGRWSAGSPEWNAARRAQVAYEDGGDDGRFFMDWKDFTTHFNRVYCCLLGTCAADAGRSLAASWDPAARTAGGKVDFGTFRRNPAFALRVELAPALAAKAARVRVALTLSMPDGRSAAAKADYPPVGLLAFDGDGAGALRAHRNLAGLRSGAVRELAPAEFWNKRDVSVEVALPVADRARALDAVVVPSTWLPDVASPFWLSAAVSGVDGAPPELATSAPPSLALAALERPLPRGARAEGAWSKAAGTARGRVGQQRPTSWQNPKWELRVGDASAAAAGAAEEADVHIFLAQRPPAGYSGAVGELPKFHGVGVYILDGYGALRNVRDSRGIARARDRARDSPRDFSSPPLSPRARARPQLREHEGKMAKPMVGGPDGNFSNYGEISAVRQLRPREEPYILMPATFGKSADEEGEFMLEVLGAADCPALSLAPVAADPAEWPEDSRPASEYSTGAEGGKRKVVAKGGGKGGAGHKPGKARAPKPTTMSMSAAGKEVKGLGDMFAGLE